MVNVVYHCAKYISKIGFFFPLTLASSPLTAVKMIFRQFVLHNLTPSVEKCRAGKKKGHEEIWSPVLSVLLLMLWLGSKIK